MSDAGALRPDPTVIGDVAAPPFARMPDPTTLFRTRAARLRALAQDHALAPYLEFVAALCDGQDRLQADLPEPDMPDAASRSRARHHAMPPLDRSKLTVEPSLDAALNRMLAFAIDIEMPPSARAALDRVRNAGARGRQAMVRAVLDDAIPVETLADHVYVAAALQVHFARQAARLDASELTPIADGTCPACGGAPVASAIVGWHGAAGARFCTCSLCATQWHVVRVKCVLCSSTKGIAYQEVEGVSAEVKAETCESCRGYVKILHQHKEPALDPVADDVASLGLDLLLRDEGYRRGAFNPFVLGY